MIFSNVFSVSIPCSRNMSAAHILARNPNIVAYQWFRISIVEGGTIFKTLVRYLLAREGVYATGGPTCLTHQSEIELLIRILCITTLHGINKSVRIKIKCTFYTIILLFF